MQGSSNPEGLTASKSDEMNDREPIQVGNAEWKHVILLSRELLARVEDAEGDSHTPSTIASVSRRIRDADRALKGLLSVVQEALGSDGANFGDSAGPGASGVGPSARSSDDAPEMQGSLHGGGNGAYMY